MTERQRFSNPEVDSTSIKESQLEELIELQSSILGETVTSHNCDELLKRLCLFAEKLTSNAVASIMLFDKQHQQLFVHTAPSIPAQAIEDLNGLKAGDGSCGNAVYHNQDMFVCDTAVDARWENIRQFAVDYKINACWSSPIHDTENEAIGSFSLSSFQTRMPDNFHRRLINICASIAGIIFQREAAINENQKAKEKLQESRENLEVTIESIADGVISTDINGNIMIFNQVAEKMTGWTSQQAIGKKLDSVFDIRNPDGFEIVCTPTKCVVDTEKCYRDHEHLELISADGSSRYIALSEAPLKNNNNDITGLVIAFRDTTQQRVAHEALAASQQQYRCFVDNSADAMYLHDNKGQIVDVNQMACECLGYSREELLSMSVLDLDKSLTEFHELDISSEDFSLDHTFTVEAIHQRKDGSRFPVEVRVRRFLSHNEPMTVALVRDISERKKVEAEILKARKLESIGILAGGIAHDFNNLLGIIQGYVDLANRSTDSAEKVSGLLKKAFDATVRATDLTQQLLTFSKGGEPIKKAANIIEIIHQSTDFSLHGSNIQINYHCSENIWTAEIDSAQISQVIQNLAINARQAMPDGGRLDIYCENAAITEADNFIAMPQDRYIKVTVKDTGIGIPQEIIDSIFDPYFTTKQQGSGLGLALSYSIIKKHGGYITVDSVPDIGATFTIYLPVSGEQAPASSAVTEVPDKKPGNARIMVMDDDEMIRDVSEEMLKNLGYEVILASDGETAKTLYLEAMNTNKNIDLVIMDLTIPSGIGGKEAIKLIQEIDPGVRALVSSGYSNDPVMANYSDYGFMGAVRKPYNHAELGAAISAILNQ